MIKKMPFRFDPITGKEMGATVRRLWAKQTHNELVLLEAAYAREDAWRSAPRPTSDAESPRRSRIEPRRSRGCAGGAAGMSACSA